MKARQNDYYVVFYGLCKTATTTAANLIEIYAKPKCLSHSIYSKTVQVLMKFGENAWFGKPFICNKWYDFVLCWACGFYTCKKMKTFSFRNVATASYHIEGLNLYCSKLV